MKQVKQVTLLRYGIPALAVVGALLLNLSLESLLQVDTPFLLFSSLTVMVCAYCGGLEPGLLAIMILALASNYSLMQSTDSTFQLRLEQTLFAIEGLGICFLTTTLHTAKQRAEVSQHKLLQQQAGLRQREDHFRATFSQAAVGIAHVSPDGRLLLVNQRLCNIVGYSQEELLARTFQEITYPDDLDQDLEYIRRMLANQIQTYWLEKRYIRKDNSLVWVNLTVSLVHQPSGKPEYFIAVIEDITRRKRAETALQESKDQLRLITDALPVLVSYVDAEQHYRFNNQAYEQWWGRPRTEVTGQHLRQVLGELPYQAIQPYVEVALSGKKVTYETFMAYKDARMRWINAAYIPHFGAQGEVKGFVALVSDITERKQAEEALRASESRLRTIIEAEPECVKLVASDGTLLDINTAGLAMIEADDADAVIGESVYSLIAPEHREAFRTLNEDVCNLGTKEILEFEIIGCRGTRRWMETYAVPLHNESDGTLVQLGITRDITERKRAREALLKAKYELEMRVAQRTAELVGTNRQLKLELNERKQVEEALALLTHQNQLILNSLGEGLCSLDSQGRITFANLAAANLLAYPVEELTGQPINTILLHPRASGTSDSLEKLPVYASLRDGTVHSCANKLFWRKDNSSIPVDYISTPIREKAKIIGAVIAFRDITERQAVEQMKNEFISVVSHELRTPLTSLHGSLRMLDSGLVDAQSEKGQHLVKIAVDSTDRLVRLINDILDVERIESGKSMMERQVCHVADLITQAVNVMQAMAEKASVTLSVSTPSTQIWADPDRIIQTLTNLLSNAIKFSPPDTNVWLTAESQVNHILFQVKDQGRGIPADRLATIFERFQQIDASDSRNQEGTGLGLAICRSIVQQHEGRIWVRSVLGKGSTFYFTLPMWKDDSHGS